MSVEESIPARPEARVSPIRAAPLPSPDPVELAERALRTAVGIASLVAGFVTTAVAEAIRGEVREPPDEPIDDESWPKPLVPVLAGAAFGVVLEAARFGGRAASTVGRSLGPWVSFAKSPSFVRERLGRIRGRMDALDERWRDEQREDERIGASFAHAIVPQVVDAALDQLDLTELVLARVDLDRVVDAVDLERVVARIDIEAIAARIDVDAIVASLDLNRIVANLDLNGIVDRIDVAGIVDRIDLDAVVGKVDVGAIVDRVDVGRIVERVDLDAVAARIDVEAIVRRLDLAAIAQEVIDRLDLATIAKGVIDEIDLPGIVRESTGTMADETVEGIRAQSMSADRAMSRFVDRLLRREGGRDEPGGDT